MDVSSGRQIRMAVLTATQEQRLAERRENTLALSPGLSGWDVDGATTTVPCSVPYYIIPYSTVLVPACINVLDSPAASYFG